MHKDGGRGERGMEKLNKLFLQKKSLDPIFKNFRWSKKLCFYLIYINRTFYQLKYPRFCKKKV